MKKFLIVGLGNIGDEYAHTRHNIGFDVADAIVSALAKKEQDKNIFSDRRYAMVSYARFKGRHLVIIKPSTFMNLSGKAVNYWLAQEKIERENLLVIADDIALPFGKIRVKKNGSDGGHNGLTSIIETLGTEEFSRLRFGIGGDFPRGKQVDYVLGKWNEEEKKTLSEKVSLAVDAVKGLVTTGIEKTMTQFNKK
ncbi:MAG TPA: aminoacyl-tRNA hydrolase [Bacteroidia bacterium]|nr:aminoacyl-tRNA hydrolase [Bacteroidia bacterium]